MFRFIPVALILVFGVDSVISAQQPVNGPIRASIAREVGRSVTSAPQQPAKQAGGLEMDDRVRILTQDPPERIVGLLVRVDEHTVTLVGEKGSPVAVPRSRIALIERSAGEPSRAGRATFGAIAGALGGAYLSDALFCKNTVEEACGVAFVSAHLFGLIGGVAGATSVGPELWTPVTLDAPARVSAVTPN
jgi:hypothetical protein